MAVAERARPTREEAATTAAALVSARANLLLAKIEGPSRAMLRRFPRNEPASSMATTEVVKVVADGSGAADRKLLGHCSVRTESDTHRSINPRYGVEFPVPRTSAHILRLAPGCIPVPWPRSTMRRAAARPT